MKIALFNAARCGLVVAAAVLAMPAAAVASTESAQYGSYTMSARDQERAIERAFDAVLRREPTSSEMRRYRNRMTEDHWNEADVRDDLRSRDDYRGSSRDRNDADVDKVIRRAYNDILHRAPDNEGLRLYRREMIDNGWTEQDVRQALRKSPEHGTMNQASADRIIQRAYQDILGRKPDFSGLVEYRNQMMNHGWDDHDVREALKRSPEYPPEEHDDPRAGRTDRQSGLPQRARPRSRPARHGRVRPARAARPLVRVPSGTRTAQQRRVPQQGTGPMKLLLAATAVLALCVLARLGTARTPSPGTRHVCARRIDGDGHGATQGRRRHRLSRARRRRPDPQRGVEGLEPLELLQRAAAGQRRRRDVRRTDGRRLHGCPAGRW